MRERQKFFQEFALLPQAADTPLLSVDQCNGWALIEAVSLSGVPWQLNIQRTMANGVDNIIRISVARFVRVCLMGRSFITVGQNKGTTEPNTVAVTLDPNPEPVTTSNCFQVPIQGTGPTTIAVPNHAESVRMDVANPSSRPNTLLSVRNDVLGRIVAAGRAGEQPLRLGLGSSVEWSSSVPVDGSLTFFYPF